MKECRIQLTFPEILKLPVVPDIAEGNLTRDGEVVFVR